MAALAERLGVSKIMRMDGTEVLAQPLAFSGDDDFSGPGRARQTGYDLVGPVAVIQVEGTLVQKLGTLRPYSGMTGYDGIRQNFLEALSDPAVEAIVLDIDSPGGEVAGCFDLVDTIYAARGEKPIWSVLSESAYSAGYAIASAADRIVVPRTGGTGSIGVISMHVDWSQALTEAGVKVTFITYGERKADGHPEIPLSRKRLRGFKLTSTPWGAVRCHGGAQPRHVGRTSPSDGSGHVYGRGWCFGGPCRCGDVARRRLSVSYRVHLVAGHYFDLSLYRGMNHE